MINKQPVEKVIKQVNRFEHHQIVKKLATNKLSGKPLKNAQPLEQEWLNLAQDWQQQPF